MRGSFRTAIPHEGGNGVNDRPQRLTYNAHVIAATELRAGDHIAGHEVLHVVVGPVVVHYRLSGSSEVLLYAVPRYSMVAIGTGSDL